MIPSKPCPLTLNRSNATFDTLEAVPDPTAGSSPTAASKLLVGPQVLRRTLPAGAWQAAYGPYWVVALGESWLCGEGTLLGWGILAGGAGCCGCSRWMRAWADEVACSMVKHRMSRRLLHKVTSTKCLRHLSGPSKNSTIAYDWAVITGGPPRTPSNGACRTGRLGPQSLQVNWM